MLLVYFLLSSAPLQMPVTYTAPGDLPIIRAADGHTFPLKETHVKAALSGPVGRVEVEQRFFNDRETALEATYVFPLPENSAVIGLTLHIGERIIEAQIKTRADARRVYEQAKHDGHTAALLEQERANIFTQSLANIPPHTEVRVTTRYLQTLTYDAGTYEFVFPMVVGPRFSPPGSPDEHLSPTLVGKGERSGHDIFLELTANAGTPIGSYEVPTHEVSATLGESLSVKLSPKDTLPNRDFVLRYHVAGAATQAAVLTHHDARGGFIALMVQPPKLDIDALVGARELVFVVDVSGSMWGEPLGLCKDAMREALANLRPVDTFNVITFSGNTAQLFAQAREANDENITHAQQFVNDLTAGGGTMMLDGVKAALSPEHPDLARNRYVFFMTDGYVGNEAEIVATAGQYVKAFSAHGRKARVFGFGVGSSPNRLLIEGLGKEGQGAAVYASTREDPALAAKQFFRIIDKPILEDVHVDWAGLPVSDVYPSVMPDLLASRPLVIMARYSGSGTATAHVRGTANGQSIDVPFAVTLSEAAGNEALAPLWARAKITDLERPGTSSAEKAITETGLAFSLVTRFTSFVAVDSAHTVHAPQQSIAQPVDTPEGVDGGMADGLAGRSAAPMQMLGYVNQGLEGRLGKKDTAVGYGSGAVTLPHAQGLARTETVPSKSALLPASPRLMTDEGEVEKAKPKASELAMLLRAHRAAVRQCFEETSVTSITLEWTVDAAGLVQAVTVSTEPVSQCLMTQLKSWHFLSSSLKVRSFTYTFSQTVGAVHTK